ncbi:Homeobox-leucine zipper protein HDG2 [Abeliophyllum distichum]|uniref:Homeobox-leucine zipper protein HDG2 n=1 Tax=Abeliophyllum distichum TaxID=126358 RepID=A0ABD1UQL9_9LAMI
MMMHWDILSQDGPIQQMFHVSKDLDFGNSISLLCTNDASVLMLQETCTDDFESLVIHAAVDLVGMDVVMSGGDSTFLPFLQSGFTIVPNLFRDSDKLNYNERGSGGSLLTIGFYILGEYRPS